VRYQHECAHLLAKGYPARPESSIGHDWSYTNERLHMQKPVSAGIMTAIKNPPSHCLGPIPKPRDGITTAKPIRAHYACAEYILLGEAVALHSPVWPRPVEIVILEHDIPDATEHIGWGALEDCIFPALAVYLQQVDAFDGMVLDELTREIPETAFNGCSLGQYAETIHWYSSGASMFIITSLPSVTALLTGSIRSS
jgi:hypothetical protein